ncbi:MAG: helix-turn-helix domain-containing protein [Halobacteria archaeon]|nr:helix-turn-helix domain-containing protein [Halobacteria archaeon]
MPRAKLRVRLPERTWISQVSRENPDTVFTVVAVIPDSEGGVGLVEIKAQEVDGIVGRMREHDDVTDVEVLRSGDTESLVQFETSNPMMLSAAHDSGVPIETPFDIQDGELNWQITASHDRLSELGDRFEEIGVEFEIEYVRDVEFDRLLTQRQRRLVLRAVEMGYYDTPRDCSLTQLAEAAGIAKSTCSEVLHRAEEKIVKNFVNRTESAQT